MTQFDRITLGRQARELGFVRDTFEKVCRLADVLAFLENDALLSKTLALKGGTAINLTIFDLPRLSVDIDLDYSENVPREEMLAQREIITERIRKYMAAAGYRPGLKSKTYILLVADLTRIARDPILWMQALRELSGKGVWIQSAAEPDAFRVNPFFTYGCRRESNGNSHSMNYEKLTAGTTKTAIDTVKTVRKGRNHYLPFPNRRCSCSLTPMREVLARPSARLSQRACCLKKLFGCQGTPCRRGQTVTGSGTGRTVWLGSPSQLTTDIFSRKLGTAGEKIFENLST